MKYLIFLRKRIGGGRFIAYFANDYFHLQTDKGSISIHKKDVKRRYLK